MTVFRNATLDDLRLILQWAGAEGWNPGLNDAEAFYAADPQGFFVACQDNETVAAISVVNHNDSFSFLGLYIVRPEYRGQGIGYGLWHHALKHAENRVVGLDGVEDQQQNYANSGFRHAGGTTRFSGTLPGVTHGDIRLVRPGDVERLVDMEAAASGVRKPAYLAAWFAQDALRKTLICEQNGAVQGACTVRKCGIGAKIGPLIAAQRDTARRLMEHAATVFDGPLTLDVPAGSKALAALCKENGMEPGFRTARMYRGAFKPVGHDLFAVTSLELG